MKHQGQNTPIIKTHIAKLEMMKHQGQNDESPGAKYPNKNDSEDTETNKTSTISNFMLTNVTR